jgi:hypothetical protein
MMMRPLARVEHSSRLHDSLVMLERYKILSVSNRLGFEFPELLPVIASQRPPGYTLIYYSLADATDPDFWGVWDSDNPHYEYEWTQAVERSKLWLPLPGERRPFRRGLESQIPYWPGPPKRFAVNATHPEYPYVLAEQIVAWHTRFQDQIGKPLGLFLDNLWDSTSFPGKLAEADADRDGVLDERDALELEWERGMREVLTILRFHFRQPNQLIIANTRSVKYTRWLNGPWMERFGEDQRYSWLDDREVVNADWQHPRVACLHGRDPLRRYAFAAAMLTNHAMAGHDSYWDAEASSIDWYDKDFGVGERIEPDALQRHWITSLDKPKYLSSLDVVSRSGSITRVTS